MANGDVLNTSRLGLKHGGAANDLFLKVFANEILTTFDEKNVMKDLHTIRTIQSGKSAQFPVTGIATAKYHVVGEDVLESDAAYSSSIKHSERVINIDDVLLAATFIANIDEMKNHYDVRSIYAKELGKALAKRFDIATMKTLFAAAGTSDVLGNDVPDGTSLDISDGDCAGFSTASNIISTITTCAQKLDENDIPEDDRFIILTPANYYKLVSANSDAISFVGANTNGTGYSRLENPLLSTGQVSLADAKVAQVAGINVIKSNHLADVIAEGNASSTATGDGASSNDVNAGAGVGYNANFTGLEGLAGHKSAIGTVKLMDLTTESEYIMTKQGTALVAKYAMGHGVLRPEAAIKIVA